MDLNGLQETIAGLAGSVGARVVGVGHAWGRGSGIVLAEGKVLTNAHNLRSEQVEVTFRDGRRAAGRAAGVDVDSDIAVIDVDTAGAEAIPWSQAEVSIGTPVFALANPGGRGLRVTFGLVSGTQASFRGPRGRRIAGSLEHTAPLLPGSSGGPVVDASGGLLGLNTNRLGEGFYLAIPADAGLRARVDALSRGESPVRKRIGVAIAPGGAARRMRRAVGLPEADGALVRGVEPDGAAAAAGVQEGDLIVAAGGRAVAGADDLHDALGAAGESIELRILRGVEERTVTVELG